MKALEKRKKKKASTKHQQENQEQYQDTLNQESEKLSLKKWK